MCLNGICDLPMPQVKPLVNIVMKQNHSVWTFYFILFIYFFYVTGVHITRYMYPGEDHVKAEDNHLQAKERGLRTSILPTLSSQTPSLQNCEKIAIGSSV